MDSDDTLAFFNTLLEDEALRVIALRATRSAHSLSAKRKEMLDYLRALVRSGNLRQVIRVEVAIVEGDLCNYANSAEMVRSLKKALVELAAVVRHLDLVADAEKYALIDQGHSLPGKRRKGLPLDDSRLALESHLGRLRNMDKARLDEDEKELIEARKALLAAAITGYTILQANALGRTPTEADE